MKRYMTVFFIFAICSSLYSGTDFKTDGKRPFKETEVIDTELLQNLINKRIAEVTRKAGAKMVLEPKIVKAANERLRNPDMKDETDSDGFHVPAVKVLLLKDGYKCGFVMDLFVEAKTICPTIRKFNSSDTYENIAARFVEQTMDGNKAMILQAKFYGAGVYLYDDWERNEQGPIYNEPKCQRIRVSFVFVYN